jgi:predicted metal-dependent hydrolase
MESKLFMKCTIFFILLLSLYMFIETDYVNELKFMKSDIDGHEYLVRNASDSKDAANILSRIRTKSSSLIDSMLKKHPDDSRVKLLKKRFNPFNISESYPNSEHTSYSINKGEKIVFCLRSKDNAKKLHDFNTITFVALHELAHLMTESIGHTKEFWDNSRFILKHAIQYNFYSKQNFKIKPIQYCGTMITDSPLRD